jgi:hypothetical protein
MLEYYLCYKEAFILGAVFGSIASMLIMEFRYGR